MKVIKLKTKHSTNCVKVDDDDFDRLNQYKWHLTIIGKNNYACRWVKINNKYKRISMHREILHGDVIDHIDMNGLNNQKENLRACTVSQNLMNIPAKNNNKLGYKGVHFSIKRNKYVAQIVLNRKTIPLGRYDKCIDAILAYNKAAIQYHGEFAFLNKLA